VSDIDFAPTICDLAGCTLGPYPGGQTKPDGISILPLLDGDVNHLDRDALLEDNFLSHTWTAVRTTSQSELGLWHYIVNYPSGFVELYNDATDPWELDNVAGDPSNTALEAHLADRLEQLRAEGRPNTPAKVTIIEESTPDGATDFSFSGDLGNFKLDDDSTKTLPKKKVFNLTPGDYTVTQSLDAAWSLTNILCPFPTDIDIPAGTITLHVLQNDDVTCTFKNLRRRPDVAVAQTEIGPYKGDNKYAIGPTKRQTSKRLGVLPDTEYQFYARIQNDGKQADTLTVKGEIAGPASMSSTIWAGTTDVTAAVLAGTYTTPSLAKGASVTLTLRVHTTSVVRIGDKQVVSFTATSTNAPGAIDIARAITKV
jgi:hypothetical protein